MLPGDVVSEAEVRAVEWLQKERNEAIDLLRRVYRSANNGRMEVSADVMTEVWRFLQQYRE